MANNETKTNAEVYREQRKARLAKAAKKKKHGSRDKVVGIVLKVICILLVVGISLFWIGNNLLTKNLDLPQRIISTATYGDEKLTVAEYNYYYMVLYNQAVSVSQQYDAQYQGFGASYFDTTKDPADQKYPGEDAPEGVETWADYFKHMAPERGFLVKTLYNKAMSEEAAAAGFKITEEQQEEIDTAINDTITTLEEYAAKNDHHIDRYISKVCGAGLNKEKYAELLERDSIAQLYLEWYQEKANDDIAVEEVNAYYEENRGDIDIATIRYFAVVYSTDGKPVDESSSTVYTEEQAKARIDEFASKITDEASFKTLAVQYADKAYKTAYKEDSATLVENIKKTTLSGLSEEFGDWAFDASRKAGDTGVFQAPSQNAFYVAYIVSPAEKDTTCSEADVRHILVKAETEVVDDNGKSTELSDEEVEANFAAAKTEAEKLLAEWKAGEKTEDSFSKLATEKTDDAGSAESGGLYEGITAESNYVPEFLSWSLSMHKPGDTGIIKTSYGYHIMYYVGGDATPTWENEVRTALSADTYNDFFNGITEDISEKTVRNEKIIDIFVGKTEDIIKRNLTSYTTY